MICLRVSFINTTLHQMLNVIKDVIKNTYPGWNYWRHIVIIAACLRVFDFRSTRGNFYHQLGILIFMYMALLKMIELHVILMMIISPCKN